MEGEVGMLQVYTGNGKGKTTAAVGLAVRAIGAGLRVYMMQFMKGKAYSEQSVLQGMGSKLRLRMTGKPFFIAEQGKLDETSRAALLLCCGLVTRRDDSPRNRRAGWPRAGRRR